MNIHHFAKSLLGEMSVSPYLGDTDMPMADMPIVLIGHSMSGLVIKKAYLLASQDSAHKTLAKRVRTFYFYVTPHRGSDWAKLLNNVLRCVYSSRAYVADLKRNSETIQSTNDEFRNYSNDLNLWSFYETQKVTLGVFRTFIVDADSATFSAPNSHKLQSWGSNCDCSSVWRRQTATAVIELQSETSKLKL